MPYNITVCIQTFNNEQLKFVRNIGMGFTVTIVLVKMSGHHNINLNWLVRVLNRRVLPSFMLRWPIIFNHIVVSCTIYYTSSTYFQRVLVQRIV